MKLLDIKRGPNRFNDIQMEKFLKIQIINDNET